MDGSVFCVFRSVKSRSTMGWYMVSLLQQFMIIFYNQAVAVQKDVREMDVTGISNIQNMAPVAFLVSCTWITF